MAVIIRRRVVSSPPPRKTAHSVSEAALLSADVIADQQERLDNRRQLVIFAQQLDDPFAELHADRSSEQQSVF
jgi:hypothetical protein